MAHRFLLRPQVWYRADAEASADEWTHRLSDTHVRELEAAVAVMLESGRARVEGNYVQLVRGQGVGLGVGQGIYGAGYGAECCNLLLLPPRDAGDCYGEVHAVCGAYRWQ